MGDQQRKRVMLEQYYGRMDGSNSPDETIVQNSGENDKCDLDSASFNPEKYLSKIMKEKSLAELMDTENEMVRQIRSLDNEMQTLVYENYNKFIDATDTIRKMKTDFKTMESEMTELSENMSSIMKFSNSINSTLDGRRNEIHRLSSVHQLLKKLQFLFELPSRLKKCIEIQSYSQAVRYYLKSKRILEKYNDMTSFKIIQDECEEIVVDLTEKLKEQLSGRDVSTRTLSVAVDLLLQLGEPSVTLGEEYLKHAQLRLKKDLEKLESQVDRVLPSNLNEDSESSVHMDVLEYVDLGCNGFITNMSLVCSSYQTLFVKPDAQQDEKSSLLNTFAQENIQRFMYLIKTRIHTELDDLQSREVEIGSTTFLVRALDRCYRKMVPLDQLIPSLDVTSQSLQFITTASQSMCTRYLNLLKSHFAESVTQLRQDIATYQPGKGSSRCSLADLLYKLENSIVEKLKSTLTSLHSFVAPDLTYACKHSFRKRFCYLDVREGVLVNFIKHIFDFTIELSDKMESKSCQSPTVLLLLSRLCMDYNETSITYILSIADEQFSITDKSILTPVAQLCSTALSTAKKILNQYVKVQGLHISQMIRKSVETRDWISTIEPRNVRAVMKRVVEDITVVDNQIGALYEEGRKSDRSSDSSKRTSSRYSINNRPSRPFAPSNVDSTLMSNIQKLFSERIDVFTSVEFSKVSIMSGIIKILLKTFLEAVRLRTFGKYGFQQIQVDSHYIQLYLWRFVSDENMVHFLLDEVVSSAANRCLDAVNMDQSVIDLICERN